MSPEAPPLLAVDGLVKRFGGFRALDVLSFKVAAGEILGLVGPNGSGKTTCINVISGLYPPDGGTVHFAGRSIGGWPSHRLVHAGINRTFQVPKPFLTLTVRENVEIATEAAATRPVSRRSCPRSILPASPVTPRASSTPRSRRCSISRGRSRPVRGFC
jgi:ABC-type branched-subunit amino acid transport system ATPase component